MKLYVPFVSARTAYLYSSFLISLDHFRPLTVRVEVVVVALDHNDIYHTHSVRLPGPGIGLRRDLYLTTYDTHKRQISMLPA